MPILARTTSTMFGGDAASTLAIDRKEPIYDPLRSAIETVEATALVDVGSLKPVRLDVDENGTAMTLLNEDARQVKACDKAVDKLSGKASAYSLFFQSWIAGMRDGLANEARSLVQGTKFAAITEEQT